MLDEMSSVSKLYIYILPFPNAACWGGLAKTPDKAIQLNVWSHGDSDQESISCSQFSFSLAFRNPQLFCSAVVFFFEDYWGQFIPNLTHSCLHLSSKACFFCWSGFLPDHGTILSCHATNCYVTLADNSVNFHPNQKSAQNHPYFSSHPQSTYEVIFLVCHSSYFYSHYLSMIFGWSSSTYYS